MTKRGKRKIGRNDPCPCGSSKKFKRCHGRVIAPPLEPSPEQIKEMIKAHEARERVREHEQGKGRPIIAEEIAGHRVVAVGTRIYYSKEFKTFIDFLTRYIVDILDPNWGNSEIKKPLAERHQIMQWFDAVCAYQRKHHTKPKGEIQDSPMTGLISAYFGLAYNLYLLQHNAELQAYLIARLKQKDSFYAAYYETFVAAWFILAGFELSIENEQDSTRTHAEFIATKDGNSYSVEAKTRAPGKNHFDVGNQLYKALRIEAMHPRVVFIDMNVEADIDTDRFLNETIASVKGREAKLTIKGDPAPPAYVIVTNQAFHLCLEDESVPRAFLGIGYKIPDFGHDVRFTSLIDAYKARQKHADIKGVLEACGNYGIPAAFDGELAEFAYGDAERRFIIGQRYEIAEGIVGRLTTATVIESEKKAYLGFHTDDDQSQIVTAELSEAELSAYRKHPDTFFGRILEQGRKIVDPMDMFEFFLDGFKGTSREIMLDWFAKSSDLEKLKKLSDYELRLVYAERHTLSAMSRSNKGKPNE